MFYSRSARAMWDNDYSKKFWKGIKLPKFRITINKAFELVSLYTPHLLWEVPHRNVEAKRPLELPEELLASGGLDPQMIQQMMQTQQAETSKDKAIAFLMDRWLNYTPREQPGGGLVSHSMRSVVDALIVGRGVLAPRPYSMPGSQRTLTGSFRINPTDLYIDPDFCSLSEARWIAIKHVDTQKEVEQRFGLPSNALRGRTTLESSWQYSELATDESSAAHRKEGKTHDLVVWYEIFSKCGVGIANTSTESTIRDHFDSTVGQHAYIAICADVPYPLNMPSERLRKGATDEDVKDSFRWPIPFHDDDRWPIEELDFYIDPESSWPVPPLAPALGELKLLNFLVSWFANRTWSSSRDFWAVAQPYLDHYKEYINNGDDQSIIPTPVGLKSPKEAIEILTQPESRQDMTQLISFVSDQFDRRTGMTNTMYGQNEGGTQNRTAEETAAKQRAVLSRPQYMQKQTVDWQSRVAQAEALVTRWFVTADDVRPLLGDIGAMYWSQFIESTDVELVCRQFNYTVSASSIRRPDRERDINNFQQVMGNFAPVLQGYAQQTGNYDPFNGLMAEWGRLHDMDMAKLQVPKPDPEAQQKEQEFAEAMQQAQLQELQAKAQKLMVEAQETAAQAETAAQQAQIEQAMAMLQMQMEQLKQQGEAEKRRGELEKQSLDLQMKELEATMKLVQDAQKHAQEMTQDRQMHEQDIEQKQEQAVLDMQIKRQQAKANAEMAKAKAKQAEKTPKKKGEPK